MLLNISMVASEAQRKISQVNAQGLVLHHAAQLKGARIHFVVVMEYATALKWFERGYGVGNGTANGSENERRVYAVIKFTKYTTWKYLYRLFMFRKWRNKLRLLSIAGVAVVCCVGDCGLVVSATSK